MQTLLNSRHNIVCPFCGGASIKHAERKKTVIWKCIECNKKSSTLKNK